jgi:hypothetical protein
MKDILDRRRHRFDALFALLTDQDTALVPQDPRLLRDAGLSETRARIEPSRITPLALVRRASR